MIVQVSKWTFLRSMIVRNVDESMLLFKNGYMDGCMSRCKDDKMEGGMSKIDGCMDSYD